MKLYTKDYTHFQILDGGSCLKEFEGVEHACKALPGDEVSINGSLIRRTDHPPIVGIIHLQSKTKYGITSRGYPIYLFEPINKAYPIMIAGCSEKATTNMIGIAKFESWAIDAKYPRANLIRLLGPCGDLAAERETLLLRYSPWPYPKTFDISPNYTIALHSRPLIKGFTFNIDPPGCEDVDDVFTLEKDGDCWNLYISITDVASAIEQGSTLDLYAQKVGQSLYPTGQAPKHMLPPSLGTNALSLSPGNLRNCISLHIRWSSDGTLYPSKWILGKVSVDQAYTYAQAQIECRSEFQALKTIVTILGSPNIVTSEEWVETLMIYYNKEAGTLLRSHETGILRGHTAPDQDKLQRWEAIDPSLRILAYSSAEYTSTPMPHWGLGIDTYTHASSPLRRYADLYNQRCLIAILQRSEVPKAESDICRDLNLLGRNAKSFERDLFFLECLQMKDTKQVKGRVIEIKPEKSSIQVWVPTWNRVIRVKKSATVAVGNTVLLKYYVQYQNARWKDKIVFDLTDANTDCPE